MTQPIVSAWLFPGPPACSAMAEIADGRHIDTLKPQYHRLSDTGILIELDALDPSVGCNGYSPTNAAIVKRYSTQQFITVSATIAGVMALAGSTVLLTSFINGLIAFLNKAQFSGGGVELDVEGFGQWTAQQYTAYKNIVNKVGQALHNAGYQLMLDGPVILNSTYQGYYLFKYEDFNTLPVDYLVAMCYDLELDRGIGIDVSKFPLELTLTPVCTLQDITDCCTWMLSKVKDPMRIVIGLPTYGYIGKVGTYTATNQTYQQIAQVPGFVTMPQRDTSSGELWWMANNTVYDYSDAQTLNWKVQAVLKAGLSQVSLWHLGGGNAWPTLLQPTPVPTPDPTLAAFNAAYPGFAQFYQKHVDSGGNFIP